MRTVYLDELFVLNLAIDYILLLFSAKLLALPLRRRRYLAAAALGAAWSAVSLLPGFAVLRTPGMHPVLALAMTLAAFGRERRLWKCLLAFLAVSAMFAGASYAAGLYRGGRYRSGPLVHIDLRVLAFSFAVCWAAVSLVFRAAARRAGHRLHAVTVRLNGREAALTALEDTGNGLFDPLTGRAAMAAEARAVLRLFPGLRSLPDDPVEAVSYLPRARLLPYAGIDGKNRLLPAFLPDGVTVDGEKRDDLLVAIVPKLGEDGSYNAII